MESRQAFGQVLRMARKRKAISQETFSEVSSRTYISGLERGLKNPTLEKIDQISTQIGVHPLTLLAATFALRDGTPLEALLGKISKELEQLFDDKDLPH